MTELHTRGRRIRPRVYERPLPCNHNWGFGRRAADILRTAKRVKRTAWALECVNCGMIKGGML